uniref:Uncharacterized protein n=1 Tax=Anguilla anguilla TaxID=7936 RepID=A0A0E9XCD9_ANGAN
MVNRKHFILFSLSFHDITDVPHKCEWKVSHLLLEDSVKSLILSHGEVVFPIPYSPFPHEGTLAVVEERGGHILVVSAGVPPHVPEGAVFHHICLLLGCQVPFQEHTDLVHH